MALPVQDLLSGLPEKVRRVFTRKALYHSDEYYQVRACKLCLKAEWEYCLFPGAWDRLFCLHGQSEEDQTKQLAAF